MDSALLKLPLLLIEMYCAHKAVKPPNPPSPQDEQARYSKPGTTKSGDIVYVPNLWGPFIYRRIFYLVASAEIVAVLMPVVAPSSALPCVFHPTTSLSTQVLRPSAIYLYGLLMMCTGCLIRVACYRHMGRLFTFELSVKKGHQLVTTGPYAIVRHPSYVGSCLFYFGACLSQLGSGSWLAESGLWETSVGLTWASIYIVYSIFISFVLLARIPKEDRMMKREFQDQWVAYAKQTPYRVIPYVY